MVGVSSENYERRGRQALSIKLPNAPKFVRAACTAACLIKAAQISFRPGGSALPPDYRKFIWIAGAKDAAHVST
jgi:hypothetical protein